MTTLSAETAVITVNTHEGLFLLCFVGFCSRYEQGVRTQVTHELAELREQQKAFCDSLEELIDQAEEEEEREEREDV